MRSHTIRALTLYTLTLCTIHYRIYNITQHTLLTTHAHTTYYSRTHYLLLTHTLFTTHAHTTYYSRTHYLLLTHTLLTTHAHTTYYSRTYTLHKIYRRTQQLQLLSRGITGVTSAHFPHIIRYTLAVLKS